jgi:hypothetical protein
VNIIGVSEIAPLILHTLNAWASAQFFHWCVNNGDHETKGHRHTNWNAELAWKMRMELQFQWDVLEDDIPRLGERLVATIGGEIRSLKDICQGEFQLSPVEATVPVNR